MVDVRDNGNISNILSSLWQERFLPIAKNCDFGHSRLSAANEAT
jgi:hypothetical protein